MAQAEPADPAHLTGDSLVTLAHEMRYPDISSLYAAIGEGHVAAGRRRPELVQALGGHDEANEDLAEATPPSHGGRSKRRANADPGVVVKGVEDVWVKLARCCTPVPGDPIHRLRHPGQRRLRAPRRLRQRGVALAAARAESSTSSGPPPSPRSSWSPSRSRRWTAPGSSRTSRGSSRTSTSTSCRRPSRPPVTGWPPPASPSRWATPSTWATSEGRTRRGGRLRRLPGHLGPQAVTRGGGSPRAAVAAATEEAPVRIVRTGASPSAVAGSAAELLQALQRLVQQRLAALQLLGQLVRAGRCCPGRARCRSGRAALSTAAWS